MIQTIPVRTMQRQEAEQRALIVPLVALAVTTASVLFMPSRSHGTKAGVERERFAVAGLPMVSASGLAMPGRLAIPTPVRPPIPTFSSFVEALAQHAPAGLAQQVRQEFMQEPRLAQTWNEFAANPGAPAEDFVGRLARLPEFHKLVSHFQNDPSFRGAFLQAARQPLVDSVLKAALVTASPAARASAAGSPRGILAMNRGAGVVGGQSGSFDTFGSGVPHNLAAVPDVRDWREAGAGDAGTPVQPDAAAMIGSGRPQGLALNAAPQLLSNPSVPSVGDTKTVSTTEQTTTSTVPTTSSSSSNGGNHMVAGAITGAVGGAAVGFVVAGPVGAVVGAVVGGVVGGILGSLF